MSLILEALRKMEQDRKARRGAATDIRPEVLRYRAAVKTQQSKPYLPIAAGLVLLAAGIGAGVLLKGNREAAPSKAIESAATTTPAAPPATQAAPLAPPAPAYTPVAPTAPASVPVAPAVMVAPASNVVAPTSPAVALPAPAAAPRAAASAVRTDERASASAQIEPSRAKPVRKSAAAARRERAEAAGMTQAKPPERDPVEEVQTATDIAISGIAYQDERRLRRAVLNGMLVGEGAEIAGARVVEIRENKVRLSRGGRLFDVVFSSGLR